MSSTKKTLKIRGAIRYSNVHKDTESCQDCALDIEVGFFYLKLEWFAIRIRPLVLAVFLSLPVLVSFV
ncbi:MAG: hypothetical protein JRF37_01200 [Deltaproteobacteria bacterium]|nr:hypothetical protein [Deltaproteobacteria bacterium]